MEPAPGVPGRTRLEERRPHVVIIGGGFGGLYAARGLARAPARVTVIDRQNYHLFQPLLYQVALGVLSPGDIASPIRWLVRRQRNTHVLLAEAVRINPDARTVDLDVGTITYDYLILASGARHAYFGHDEWEAAAPGLKSLDDALAIRRRLFLAFERAEREVDPARRRELLTFAIVGGGPTGVELAGALAGIARHSLLPEYRTIDPASVRVVLLEAAPAILPSFPERLQAEARRALARLGVEVRTGAAVTRIEPGSVYVGDERIAAQTILWAAGVQASPLGRTLGVPTDRAGRIYVEPDLSLPGRPEIFVAGDLALFVQDGRPLPAVAQVAIQQGRHAARSIRLRLEGEATRPFRYRDYGQMAAIGRNAAVADIRGVLISGRPAWMVWLLVHILWLIGFRNRVMVLMQWAWAYVTSQRNVRLITGTDPAPAPERRRP